MPAVSMVITETAYHIHFETMQFN